MVTIYHNPDCGTSRNVLAMIRASGEAPEVVLYLETPPDRATLERLIAAMGIRPATCCAGRGRPTTRWGWTIRRWTTRPWWMR